MCAEFSTRLWLVMLRLGHGVAYISLVVAHNTCSVLSDLAIHEYKLPKILHVHFYTKQHLYIKLEVK